MFTSLTQISRSSIVLLCLTSAVFATTSRAATDAEILDLIDALRPTAESVVIDGDLSDWGAVPFYDDPIGDAGADPNFDFSSFAIAPVTNGILFAVETVGSAPAVGSFVVGLEFARGPRPDLEIAIAPSGNVHAMTVFDNNGQVASTTTITGLSLAVGVGTFELEIPNAALAAALPFELANELVPGPQRSFLRAGISSESSPGLAIDEAPSIGSYRLLPTPFALDPPLPTGIANAGQPPVEVELPLMGRWFVGQGADGQFTHFGSWSYDLTILNDDFQASDPDLSLDNNDYFAFGAPLFAPASGTVTVAIGSNPDNVPFTPASSNNEVRIDIGGGHDVRLLHAKQNTTIVGVGQAVDQTTQVAEVGNSGFSFQTHLHIDVLDGSATHPLAFRFVDVALNPVDDPWLRQVASWEPRSGFFVTVPEPSLTALCLVGWAAILLPSVARRRGVTNRLNREIEIRHANE